MVLVSVIVVTFNHESYIREALQSIVDQKVNFTYEIIVANDASSDETLNIIQEFKDKYPQIIIQNNEKNLGVLGNVVNLVSLVQGKYFAILDGDDYWSYEHKLQNQIDFLEENKEYNGVFHDSTIIVEDQSAEKKLFSYKKFYSQSYFYKEVLHPSDIVNRLILPSSSAVFRNENQLLDDFHYIEGDFSVEWKLSCLLIKRSKFYYINEPWSVYRNHSQGISKSRNADFHFSHIHFLKKLIKDEFYKDYKYDLFRAISNEYSIILNSKNNKYNKRNFFKYLIAEINRIWFYKKKLYEIKKYTN